MEALALSVPLYVSPSRFEEKLLVLLTYAQHMPSDSLSERAVTAIANYLRQLNPRQSLGLLAWAANTPHRSLSHALQDIHRIHHHFPAHLSGPAYQAQDRAFAHTRQQAFHAHALAATEAPAEATSTFISAALASLGGAPDAPADALLPADHTPPASPTDSVPSLYNLSTSDYSEGDGAPGPSSPAARDLPRVTFAMDADQFSFLGHQFPSNGDA